MSNQRIVEAFDLEDVSPALKLAAIYLGDNGAPETHEMTVSLNKLARFCCIPREFIFNIVKNLIWVGFLENAKENEDGKTCTVWFSWHESYYSNRPLKAQVSKEARAYVEQRDKCCVYCRCPDGPYHIDHIVPSSRGGSNDISNLALACASCNISKRDRTPEEWGGMKGRGFDLTKVNEIRGQS